MDNFTKYNWIKYNRPSTWPVELLTTENLKVWERVNVHATNSFGLALLGQREVEFFPLLKVFPNSTWEYCKAVADAFKEGERFKKPLG